MNIKVINRSKNALPAYETMHAAGMDLRADLDEPVTLQSLERKLIPTGLYIELPQAMKRRFVRVAGWHLNMALA